MAGVNVERPCKAKTSEKREMLLRLAKKDVNSHPSNLKAKYLKRNLTKLSAACSIFWLPN